MKLGIFRLVKMLIPSKGERLCRFPNVGLFGFFVPDPIDNGVMDAIKVEHGVDGFSTGFRRFIFAKLRTNLTFNIGKINLYY